MDDLTQYILSHLEDKTLLWLLDLNKQRQRFLSPESEQAIRETLARRKTEEI